MEAFSLSCCTCMEASLALCRLDIYIHDYFVKRNLHATARAFQAESRIPRDPVAIDTRGGFLMEWWSVFWDVFVARTNEKHHEFAASPIQVHFTTFPRVLSPQKSSQHQSLAPQHRGKRPQQIPKQGQSQQQQFSKGTADVISSKSTSLKRQKTVSANPSAAGMYEGRLNLPLPMHLHSPNDNLTNILEPYQLQMLKSAAISGRLSGQTLHGILRGNSRNLDQVHKTSQQHVGIRSKMNSVAASRAAGSEESSLLMTGLDQGGSSFPLKGWPLTVQSRQPFMLQPGQTTLGTVSDLEAHTLRMLLGSNRSVDHSLSHVLPIGSPPLQNNSPVPSVGDMDALLMQQLLNSNQQQKLCLQNSPIRQESMNQNDQAAEHEIGPKSEQPLPVASPAINSETANTLGPSPSSVSTLPAHLLGHEPPVPSMSSLTFAAEAVDLLKLPTTQLADRDCFLNDESSEANIGSPLSREDAITSSGVRLDDNGTGSEGFSVKEIYVLPPGQSKVECCDFSSGGKFLVTGGHDNKATLWCTGSFSMMSKLEEHSMCITDVRFSPSMPRLATSSADKTVRIWNVDHPGCSLHTFTGHSSPVMSLDFHPSKDDLICSSDCDNEIRYWSIKSGRCSGVLKGGANHMRFQPRLGRSVAAAAENFVSLLDVETQVCRQKLQGHQSTIHKLCWDSPGELLASVSDDLVQTLELWDMKEDQKTSLLAHENLISCLAASNVDGFMASASYDKCVKIWN
ncbi:hypothetical protein CDL15_Pgr015418 [Punica granatum]|uniref:Transcriptional corepressor LEUNIG-like n=1 Tax=Punica granatum TaxID=22663 RepID=A0A218W0B7_PUNGR|nr:hypothetical protein CDL15_Pgr015418 [Punica granatum]